MSDLRIIEGGKQRSPAQGNLTNNRQRAEDMQFGAPPSLLTGIITATFGAGAAVISLLVYFEIWQPEPYISQHWLVFVFAGAVIGFFLRLERAIEEALNPSRCVGINRR